jgi:Uma2 family endonuclease
MMLKMQITENITLNVPHLTIEGFKAICKANQNLQLEREATGEIIIMPPTFPWTGKQNSDLNALIMAVTFSHIKPSGSNVGFTHLE